MGSDNDENKKDLPPPGWKRNPALLGAKKLDEQISSRFFLASTSSSPLGHMKSSLVLIENSAHLVVWFGGAILLLWLTTDEALEAFLINVLLALTIDLVNVAVIKAVARRRRPGVSKEQYDHDPSSSNLSFPSGLTSRAVLITLILFYNSSLFTIFKLPFFVWSAAVGVTKLLLGKQFLGDCVAGAGLGILEYYLMSFIWLEDASVKAFSGLFGSLD